MASMRFPWMHSSTECNHILLAFLRLVLIGLRDCNQWDLNSTQCIAKLVQMEVRIGTEIVQCPKEVGVGVRDSITELDDFILVREFVLEFKRVDLP